MSQEQPKIYVYYVNMHCSRDLETSEWPVRVSAYKHRMVEQVDKFLSNLDTFWVDGAGCKEDLIWWHVNDAEEISYTAKFSELNFTQLVMLYCGLYTVPHLIRYDHWQLIQSISAAIYQYLQVVNRTTRRKVLKFMDSEYFNDMTYKKMKNDFTTIRNRLEKISPTPISPPKKP